MKIAVEGCAHGNLDNIYGTIEVLEKENGCKIDLLICCGDFQSTRNLDDLKCMAAPLKYQDMCTFYKYYSGEKEAPVLTIFIGGNHEASNYLQELAYGGWVAPKIYYLGYAGVITIGGIRIAGLSGIFKGKDYCKGRYEKPPYNADSLRSCYHIRNLEVLRLKQLSGDIDIFISHDWPAGIYNHGNLNQLLKRKPYFREDIDKEALGNKPSAELLEELKPNYWFAAHLHVKFPALVEHKGESNPKVTKFLALDKCLPKRQFLQVVEVSHNEDEELELKYDVEWLAILKNTNHLLSIKKVNTYMPGPTSNERFNFTPTEDELELVCKRFNNNFKIPNNFVQTVAAYDPTCSVTSSATVQAQINPQTIFFCEKLGIDDPMSLLINESGFSPSDSFSLNSSSLESSSFITSSPSDSDQDSFVSPNNIKTPGKPSRTPLKLPQPNNNLVSKRTPIKLPEPVLSSDSNTPLKDSLTDWVSSTPSDKSNSSFLDVGLSPLFDEEKPPSPSSLPKPEFKNSTEKETDNIISTVEPGVKRFRRRNLELYKTTDDED